VFQPTSSCRSPPLRPQLYSTIANNGLHESSDKCPITVLGMAVVILTMYSLHRCFTLSLVNFDVCVQMIEYITYFHAHVSTNAEMDSTLF